VYAGCLERRGPGRRPAKSRCTGRCEGVPVWPQALGQRPMCAVCSAHLSGRPTQARIMKISRRSIFNAAARGLIHGPEVSSGCDKKSPARFRAGLFTLDRAACLDRNDGDDLEGERIHDHELIVKHEEPEVAESRDDEHDVLRDHEQAEAARHEYADANVEIDVRDPKSREIAMQDDVVDSSALLACERNTASRAGLRERLRAAMATRHTGLGASAAGGLEILSMHAALLGKRPAALLGERTAALSVQGSRLHAATSGSQMFATHRVLGADPALRVQRAAAPAPGEGA
jgi:hypothetical protein